MNVKTIKVESLRFVCRKCNVFVNHDDPFCKRCKTPIEWDQFLNPHPLFVE